MRVMSKLKLDWGINGLKYAIAQHDNIVIIDQLRFSSAVVTAIAHGFIIEPTSDKTRKTESFSLSPYSFLDKKPTRVIMASSNGAYLSTNAKEGKMVVYGSLLNAKAVGNWIDTLNNENTTLIAAGEINIEVRRGFLDHVESMQSKENEIFALEDFVAAGAISSYSHVSKSNDCINAEEAFYKAKDHLLDYIKETATHRYNASRGDGKDTEYCSKLNLYNIVPRLHFVKNVPEITSQ